MMRAFLLLFVCAFCGGCVLGTGAAIGYGKKRGFYAGVSGTVGISAGGVALEIGGTGQGAITQLRLEAEANRGKFTGWHIDADKPYPAAHAGFGAAYTEHEWSKAALIGPEITYAPNTAYCDGIGAPMVYAGIEYRYVAGESQIVFAPRYEVVSDFCLR